MDKELKKLHECLCTNKVTQLFQKQILLFFMLLLRNKLDKDEVFVKYLGSTC